MTDTRARLIEEANRLVRERGYSAFSYADLSAAVGITKASIHHHFPSKADLGEEIVHAYSAGFLAALRRISRTGDQALRQLERYAALYREGLAVGQACLCGMLAAEVDVVPAGVKDGVARFFDGNVAWLSGVIAGGQRAGDVRGDRDPDLSAQGLLAAMQGAMFLARGVQDVSAFDRAAHAAIDGLRA